MAWPATASRAAGQVGLSRRRSDSHDTRVELRRPARAHLLRPEGACIGTVSWARTWVTRPPPALSHLHVPASSAPQAARRQRASNRRGPVRSRLRTVEPAITLCSCSPRNTGAPRLPLLWPRRATRRTRPQAPALSIPYCQAPVPDCVLERRLHLLLLVATASIFLVSLLAPSSAISLMARSQASTRLTASTSRSVGPRDAPAPDFAREVDDAAEVVLLGDVDLLL